jgi:hypothetical protein
MNAPCCSANETTWHWAEAIFRPKCNLGHVASQLTAWILFCGTALSAQQVDYVPVPTPPTILPRPAAPSVYTNFIVEIGIYNGGPADSTSSLIVTNYLPQGWTLVSASVASYRISTNATHTTLWLVPPPDDGTPLILDGGRAVVFRPHPVPAGTWRPVFIEARADRTGFFTNIVEVHPGAGVVDVRPDNNRLVQAIEVLPPELSVAGGISTEELNGGVSEFTVRLTSSNSVPVEVEYHTVDGAARAREDYQETSGHLVFPPGVLERKVYVTVLDDALEEDAQQSLGLRLTNAVNARIGRVSEENWIIDNEPPLFIGAGSIEQAEEGKPGLFKAWLTGHADVPVSVDFSVTSPRSISGTVTIEPGESEGFFEVPISCDNTDDPERSFTVTLSNPRGTPGIALLQSQVSGTIGPDLAPGKYHHLEIVPITSPQLEGRPFPVTVMLKDYLGGPATNYFTPPVLASFASWGPIIANVHYLPLTNFSDGTTTVSLTFTTASTNVSVYAYNYCLGVLQSWAFSGLKVIPPPKLFVSLPPAGTEGEGQLLLTGRVSITNVDSQDVVVDLTSDDTSQLTVSPGAIIPAGQTSAVFQVTVGDDSLLNGTRSVNVSATAVGYHAGLSTMLVHDNETATLTVTIDPTYMEGSGVFTGTVTSSRPVDWNTSISVSSSDPSELTFSCCSVILAGSTSAPFWFRVENDNFLDGPQPVTVTARVQNWVEGMANTVILDNDTNLVIDFSARDKLPIEGAGTVPDTMRVTLQGIAVNPVTVELVSSDTSEIVVPTSVVIPAGQQNARVSVTYPDDNEFDGAQTVTITASVPRLRTATWVEAIPDNDVHHLVFGPIALQQTSIRISLTLKDVNDRTMSSVSETIRLQAKLGSSIFQTHPSSLSNFVRGIWNGDITIDGWGTNLQFVATATNGVSAASNPFNIPAPAWVAELRIQQVVLGSEGASLLFNTAAGKLHQIEMTPRLGDAPWQPIGTPIQGTGSPRSFLDTNASPAGQRFYRLSVTP